MIIGVTGYGYTGSGAVIDYLKGFNRIYVKDNVEFQLLQEVDGLLDLRYHLTESRQRINCNTAICRFLNMQKKGVLARVLNCETNGQFDTITKDYINKLIKCEWKGQSAFDAPELDVFSKNCIVRNIQELLGGHLIKYGFRYPFNKERFYSIMSSDEFDIISREYFCDIIKALNIPYMEKDCVFDMLFSATNPKAGMSLLGGAKCIIVDRNPVDLWIVSKRKDDNYSFMPNTNVKSFVDYYRLMHENQIKSPEALYIQYEDLIYKYEDTKALINSYLGYSNPEKEFMFFNPSKSIVYTNLEKKEHVISTEIEYIKENLGDYLYVFPESI